MVCITDARIPNATEIKEILDAHNNYRANVNPPSDSMFKLIWNSEGAVRAEEMAKKCVFAHDLATDRSTSKYPVGGQNVHLTIRTIQYWSAVVKSWYDEISKFTYGVNGGSANFKQVGHFTQVVWGTTKEVGCGMSECPQGKMFTCNYYPSGNSGPYQEPYHKSNIQSCNGCKKGMVCAKDAYAGKLLEACGMQQGDTLGSKIFCLGIHDLITKIKNDCSMPLHLWYIDDWVISGDSEDRVFENGWIDLSTQEDD
ncbi:venom allergen 5.01-like [Gordionus sp. m RMFG-2023]|uniref:venom allergen 5.01-like n=1 Tax=Gordionus sp. m RMFG-2023 TaxID=3053472 RepID=UPI0031FCC51B